MSQMRWAEVSSTMTKTTEGRGTVQESSALLSLAAKFKSNPPSVNGTADQYYRAKPFSIYLSEEQRCLEKGFLATLSQRIA